MDNPKRKICVVTANRAERGLLQPVINRLAKDKSTLLMVLDLDRPEEHRDKSQSKAERAKFEFERFEPDVILVPCDRNEMVPVAMTAFHMNIPLFHIYAGLYTFTGTHDDVNRHVISMFSHIMLCESEAAKQTLVKSGTEAWRTRVVGATHYDDMAFDNDKVPADEYDVFLMHPTSLSRWITQQEFSNAMDKVHRPTVFIGPNPDKNSDYIREQLELIASEKIKLDHMHWYYPDGLPRKQFLALLRRCKRFISNSSSGVYEAPFFGVEVVNVSMRNQYRVTPELKQGASDKVVEILKNEPLDERLMMKKLLE